MSVYQIWGDDIRMGENVALLSLHSINIQFSLQITMSSEPNSAQETLTVYQSVDGRWRCSETEQDVWWIATVDGREPLPAHDIAAVISDRTFILQTGGKVTIFMPTAQRHGLEKSHSVGSYWTTQGAIDPKRWKEFYFAPCALPQDVGVDEDSESTKQTAVGEGEELSLGSPSSAKSFAQSVRSLIPSPLREYFEK